MLVIGYELLDGLIPYDRNARTHSPAQIRSVEKSLARFGWTTPMGKADGMLIYGHARRRAAINLRDQGKAIPGNDDPAMGPTVDLSHLSLDERRAYVIADNAIAEQAGWDRDLLGIEVRELSQGGFDLSLLGFPKADLSDLMIERVGDERPGALLERVNVTIAEPTHTVSAGDHWLLSGRHHLLCASVIEGWPVWKPLLKKGSLFVPYPGPFVPFGHKAADHALVMVQPDAYVAGHLLDRYAECRGEDALKRQEAPKAEAA
jgi:hypothetical protein